jgi:hypothetical protein
MLGNLIGGFIVILVGVQLLPVVADAIMYAQHAGSNVSVSTNVTGASSTILGLTTIFYSLGVTVEPLGQPLAVHARHLL